MVPFDPNQTTDCREKGRSPLSVHGVPPALRLRGFFARKTGLPKSTFQHAAIRCCKPVLRLLTVRPLTSLLVIAILGWLIYSNNQSWPAPIVSLSSGIPLTAKSDGLNYPDILSIDVTGRLPETLQHEVASRLAQSSRQSGGPLKLLSVPNRQPSCMALIRGNPQEMTYAEQWMESHKAVHDDAYSEIIKATDDCDSFLRARGYINFSTQEELDFPIAYSVMMYRDADQAERLLRAIYRPHNHYCIHVDAKSSEPVQKAMLALSQCLPNVFMASRQNKVDWAKFNSLTPWLYCMKDLWAYKSWKYFINLTGQEFPLKTNWQIVKILKSLNGSNVVDTTSYPSYAHRWYDNFPAPSNIRPYKGLVFILASRGFVDFILHQQVSHDLLEWVSHTDFPDESYFSSLNHNTHLKVPGSYKGDPETDAITKPFIARFVNWGRQWIDKHGRLPFSWPCGGRRVRGVCIFGVRDLPLLIDRKEMFANKFLLNYQPFSLDCLEQWHFNMTLSEYAGDLVFDPSWYANLDIVKNKVV